MKRPPMPMIRITLSVLTAISLLATSIAYLHFKNLYVELNMEVENYICNTCFDKGYQSFENIRNLEPNYEQATEREKTPLLISEAYGCCASRDLRCALILQTSDPDNMSRLAEYYYIDTFQHRYEEVEENNIFRFLMES